MKVNKQSVIGIMFLLIAGLYAGCSGATGITQPATPTPTPTSISTYSQYQLEYLLFSRYPDIFWCDPDYYPVAREGQEQANALKQFSTIRANTTEFSAILDYLKLSEKTDYTDAEKLNIYREHKKLIYAITIAPSGTAFEFSLRTGKNQGQHIAGTIDSGGRVKIQTQETSFNTCPICLTRGTMIDTPSGAVPIEKLQVGMIVWTIDQSGNLVAAPIKKISSTPVNPDFKVIRLCLSDGRTLTASPGHPTAEMRPLNNYSIGDTLDMGIVERVEWISCDGGITCDLLPSGGTGLYRANGIWLKSTLID